MKTTKIDCKINSYWSVVVDDYHEFDNIRSYFGEAGIRVNYEEVGYDGGYTAIFWIKEKPKKLIKDIKKLIGDYDD